MDYNDLLLSRHLYRLNENRISAARFNIRAEEALEEFKKGEFLYQEDVGIYMEEYSRIDPTIKAFVNGSHKELTNLILEAIEYCLERYEGEE